MIALFVLILLNILKTYQMTTSLDSKVDLRLKILSDKVMSLRKQLVEINSIFNNKVRKLSKGATCRKKRDTNIKMEIPKRG